MKSLNAFCTVSLLLSTAISYADSPSQTSDSSEEKTGTQLDKVVVSANRIEQPLSQVAGSVTVLDSEELAQRGATELYDALRNEPGVTITGGAGRPQNIIIRGMTGNRIVIVKDGVRSSDGYGANDINDLVGRNSFDLANVKTLEVVKGASSSVHGSGAIGGTVAITSKQPADYLQHDDAYADINLTYTDISNKSRLGTNLAKRLANSEHLLTLSYWQGEETRNFDQDLYERELDGYSAAYTLSYQINKALSVSTKLEHYEENQLRPEGTASVQPDGKWDLDYFKQDETNSSDSIDLTADYQPLLPVWFTELNTRLYWRDTLNDESTNRLLSQPNQNDIRIKRRELEDKTFSDSAAGFNADFQHSIINQYHDHQLAWGLNIERSNFERTDKDLIIDPDGPRNKSKTPFAAAETTSAGLYLRDVMELSRWTLTAGLRFDTHQLRPDKQGEISGFELKKVNSQEWSPSLSLSYQISHHTNVYLSYDHGYRAPDYAKAYGYVSHDFVPITPFLIVPNNDIKAETSDSLELGSKFDNGHSQLYIALFYQQFEDFIDIQQVGVHPDDQSLSLRQYVNLNGVKTYGAELSAYHMLSSQWSLNTKLGYVDGKTENDEYVRSITPWEGSVGARYQNNRLSAYADWLWATSMDRVPECETDIGLATDCATTAAWHSLDLGISYEFNQRFNVSANLVNALNRKYIRYQDVAGIAQSDTGFSSEPGRYLTFNSRYQF